MIEVNSVRSWLSVYGLRFIDVGNYRHAKLKAALNSTFRITRVSCKHLKIFYFFHKSKYWTHRNVVLIMALNEKYGNVA